MGRCDYIDPFFGSDHNGGDVGDVGRDIMGVRL